MAYAQLDEHFDEHPKFEDLDLEHFGLMACALAYCNRLLTDGFISTRAVRGFGKSGKGLRVATKLVEKGIWTAAEGGFNYVGFLDHNPSRQEVLSKREEARKRKEAYRKGRPSNDTPPPDSMPEPPSVPPSVPMGQPMGHPLGRTTSVPQDMHEESRVPRARAPAGAIHFTSLHSTTLQDHPLTPKVPTRDGESVVDEPSGLPPSEWAMHEAAFVDAYESAVRVVTKNPRWSIRYRKDLKRLLETCCLGSDRRSPEAWLAEQVRLMSEYITGLPVEKRDFWNLEPKSMQRWFNDRPSPPTTAPRTPPESPPSGPPAQPTPEQAAALAAFLVPTASSELLREVDDRLRASIDE